MENCPQAIHCFVHKLTIDASMDGFWMIDLQGNLIEANPAYARMSGYSKAELEQMHIAQLEAVQSDVNIHQRIQKIMRQGWDRFESRHRRKDHSTFDVEVSVQYHPVQDGVLVAFIRDITERNIARRHLIAIKDDLQATLDAIPDLLFEVDRDGRIYSYHARYTDLLAAPPEDFLGRRFSDILPDNASRECLAAIAECLEVGWSNGKQYSLKLPQGERWFELYASPKKKTTVTEERVLLIARDITDHVLAEKTLLENEFLRTQEKLALGVAHDVNNTLGKIVGANDLTHLALIAALRQLEGYTSPGIAQARLDIQEALSWVDVGKNATKEGASRIRRLPRSARHNATEPLKALNINELLHESITQLDPLWRSTAENAGLRFTFHKELHATLPVMGIAGELSSVFHNLLKNAIEAMMGTGGTIQVRSRDRDQRVVITITDTGVGMDTETREKMFKPGVTFTTKPLDVTRDLASGRGLGTSAVYTIVHDEHGGAIQVLETAPGKGTTIEITLPAAGTSPTHQPMPLPQPHTVCLKILLVDDDAALQSLYHAIITRLGHTVTVATSGRDALSLLATQRFDLLLSDLGMPGMNGWQLAHQIKGQYPWMQVAVATGWVGEDFSEKKSTNGVQYLLAKPTSMHSLSSLLNEVIASKP